MGSIPSRDQWKRTRQDTYQLPEHVGPSLGAALDKYHKVKKEKGAEAAIKALAAVKRVVKEFRESQAVFEYYEKNKLETKLDELRAYFVKLDKDIDARVVKLKRYIAVESQVSTFGVDEVLGTRKLRDLLLVELNKGKTMENFNFITAYALERFNESESRVAAAMTFLDKYVLGGKMNVPNLSNLQELRNKEEDLRYSESRKDLTLWKQLFAELVKADKSIQSLMRNDIIPRMLQTPEARRVMIMYVGGEKALREYEKLKSEK
jgi:hypothetical protein